MGINGNMYKAKYPWEIKEISYSEWGKMEFDWCNFHKVNTCVPSYFFRYDNYIKGLKNKHITKSVFGTKSICSIEQEIEWWFNRCVGAYTAIEY